MGEFKPMVKMMTTEPTVELKLKKGGKVEKKMQIGGAPGMAPAMGGLPARGGEMSAVAPARPDMMRRRRMMKAMGSGPAAPVGRAATMMKEGGESKSEHAAEMKKMKGTAEELKKHESMPASKAHKGLKTGGVAMGQGGYKHGGGVKKYAEGGIIKTTGAKTIMHTAKPDHSPAKTEGVKMGNGGGYKKGGVAKYAKGGCVEGNVSTTPAGVSNTNTGEVVKGQGGYKKGGSTKKFARGGSVNDSGKAEAMPQGHKKPSTPVSISRLSGTFKKGGSVKMMEGGPADVADEKKRRAMDKAYEESGKVSSELEEAMNPLSMMKEAFNKAKGIFKSKPSGESVTKTKESVTVTPVKKRSGGAC